MRPGTSNPEYLHGLDGWRALAVVLVVLGHAPRMPGALEHLQTGAGLGVRIFFAISGLLICTRLLDEESRRGRISLRNFYVRRAFRILPASTFYLATLVVLGAVAVIPFSWPSWLSALFFFRNYWNAFVPVTQASWFTAHFWSLAVEEHFYFLLPSLLVFLPRRRSAALTVLSVLSFGAMSAYVLAKGITLSLLWEQRTEFCLVALLVPALFAVQLRRAAVRAFAERWLSPWLGLVLLALCITRWIHPFDTLPKNELLGAATKSILLPLMLISFITHPHHLLTRLLDLAPLRYIGRISYSLYLWQSLFLAPDFTYPTWPIRHVQTPVWLGIALSFGCAILSYHLLETPLIAAGRRFLARPAPPLATANTTSLGGAVEQEMP